MSSPSSAAFRCEWSLSSSRLPSPHLAYLSSCNRPSHHISLIQINRERGGDRFMPLMFQVSEGSIAFHRVILSPFLTLHRLSLMFQTRKERPGSTIDLYPGTFGAQPGQGQRSKAIPCQSLLRLQASFCCASKPASAAADVPSLIPLRADLRTVLGKENVELGNNFNKGKTL